MSDQTATQRMSTPGGGVAVLIAVLLGAMVAVALGVFGKIHEPQYFSISIAGFSSGLAVKAWLATLAIVLALFLRPGWYARAYLGGVTVYNDATNAGAFVSGDLTAVTNASGVYSFSGLAFGLYIVRQIPPSGDTQTTPTGNLGIHINLAANQASTGDNFGDKA